MSAFKRVLIPIDFSECSAEALEKAIELVDKFESELHLLHVLESQVGTTPVFAGGLAFNARVPESDEQASAELAKVAPDRKAVRATAAGPIDEAILGYAKNNDVQLIVMGTHGRTGLAHVMLGSVAERVVRKSRCPVMTVPHGRAQD